MRQKENKTNVEFKKGDKIKITTKIKYLNDSEIVIEENCIKEVYNTDVDVEVKIVDYIREYDFAPHHDKSKEVTFVKVVFEDGREMNINTLTEYIQEDEVLSIGEREEYRISAKKL